jgi:hypothetical protein
MVSVDRPVFSRITLLEEMFEAASRRVIARHDVDGQISATATTAHASAHPTAGIALRTRSLEAVLFAQHARAVTTGPRPAPSGPYFVSFRYATTPPATHRHSRVAPSA